MRTKQTFKAQANANSTNVPSVPGILQGGRTEMHYLRMSILRLITIPAITMMLVSTAAVSLEISCTHPERPNHSYRVTGDQGVFTWDDHDIERTWLLKCNDQRKGVSACHRSESFGERGASVMTFVMLPDGILVESGYWALLDTSHVSITSGFVCESESE
ncbi:MULTISPECIES: hypothetical protein [unclassified Ruegeria]|uniref:hypothetical protein n=1 Tax=unclassified Ruegeria TaxID=2625375 RepID=UPI0014879699|nr:MULTISPECIES: hypothetical protein [unclassified Ruegeria]